MQRLDGSSPKEIATHKTLYSSCHHDHMLWYHFSDKMAQDDMLSNGDVPRTQCTANRLACLKGCPLRKFAVADRASVRDLHGPNQPRLKCIVPCTHEMEIPQTCHNNRKRNSLLVYKLV